MMCVCCRVHRCVIDVWGLFARMAQKFKHDRIKVLARIRPLNQRELSKNDQYVLSTSSDGQYIELLQSNNHLLTSSKRFLLDGVYNEKISQEEIFQNIIPLLENYIDGYNCTIFTCKFYLSQFDHSLIL
jgi:hypothetical protein